MARRLPATEPWGDCLDLADTPEQFSVAVRRRAGEGVPEAQCLARERLASESWDVKARQLMAWALEG